MNIKASPTGGPPGSEWCAVDEHTYDGAEDSANRCHIGFGSTAKEAIADFRRLMAELAEWKEWEASRE